MDIRKQKTLNKIEAGFSALIQEKTFDSITTTEIIEASSVSRTAFYSHYNDKYDLVERYLSMFFDNLEEIITTGPDNETVLNAIFNMIREKVIYQSFISRKFSLEIQYYFKDRLKVFLKEHYQTISKVMKIPVNDRERAYEFYTAAIYGYTYNWIQDGMQTPNDQLVNVLLFLLR
jgi:AcrR family transcriptional regulator